MIIIDLEGGENPNHSLEILDLEGILSKGETFEKNQDTES
jgi:hypothetical protein